MYEEPSQLACEKGLEHIKETEKLTQMMRINVPDVAKEVPFEEGTVNNVFSLIAQVSFILA